MNRAGRMRAFAATVLCTALLGGCSGDEEDPRPPGQSQPGSVIPAPQRPTLEVTAADGRTYLVDEAIHRTAHEALGTREGAVVVLHARTGRILALVSSPATAPQFLQGGSGDVARVAAVRDTYQPGAPFTLITAAAALQAGRYQADTPTQFESPLRYPNSTRVLADPHPSCQGTTIAEAFVRSCATVFAGIGAELGDKVLREQAEKFGFNDFGKLGSGNMGGHLLIPIHATPSYFPQHVDSFSLMTASLGRYDVTATPLQMAMVAAAVGNGGTLMRPYLEEAAEHPPSPASLAQAVSPEVGAQLRAMMQGNVRARDAEFKGVPTGAKCGAPPTGQSAAGATKRPSGWCIGFMDRADGPVAVAVFTEDPGASDITQNSPLAALTLRTVLDAAHRL